MPSVLDIQRIVGPSLRGKIDGRQHFGPLCAAMSSIPGGAVVYLNFNGVEELSASWIAAAILPLIPWSASPDHDLYPVIAGLQPGACWEDEFELVANRSGEVFVVEAEYPAHRLRVVGRLDVALQTTLRLIVQHGEGTGAGLKRLCPSEPILATGWSNRLKDLHLKRLLRRTSRGREQVYALAMEVDFDGAASAGLPDCNLSATNATRSTGMSPP